MCGVMGEPWNADPWDAYVYIDDDGPMMQPAMLDADVEPSHYGMPFMEEPIDYPHVPPSEADTEGYSEFGDDEPEVVPPPQVMAGVAAGGWVPDAERRRNWRNWAWQNREPIIIVGSAAVTHTLSQGMPFRRVRDWYNAQRDVVVQRPAEKAKEKKRDVNKGFGTGAPTSKAKDEL